MSDICSLGEIEKMNIYLNKWRIKEKFVNFEWWKHRIYWRFVSKWRWENKIIDIFQYRMKLCMNKIKDEIYLILFDREKKEREKEISCIFDWLRCLYEIKNKKSRFYLRF
jgi:hypothetical protein